MNIQVGRVIPGAPRGVLGYFIESKLKEYVEPERAGTPKGESIGLSRKKYHAALLSLTSLSLRKLARQIGVSYGVIRKWRTEDAFNRCIEQLLEEFSVGHFRTMGETAWLLKLLPETAISGGGGISDDEARSISKQQLPGLDDGSLYSKRLIQFLSERWVADVAKRWPPENVRNAAATLEDDLDRLLDWFLPLNQLLKLLLRREVDRSTEVQRGLAGGLLQLLQIALYPPVSQNNLPRARRIGMVLGIVILREER